MFYIIESRDIDEAIKDPNNPKATLSEIANILFKADIEEIRWERVWGATHCFYAIQKNLFTTDWFFIATEDSVEYYAFRATKVTVLNHGNVVIHLDENSTPDALYRGKKEIVPIKQYISY